MRGVRDLNFPVGSLHSRLSSSQALALSGASLDIISFDSGEILRSVSLPVEIAAIHKGHDGDANFADFSYSLLGNHNDGLLVI